jgi:hypothetical protein
MLPSTDSASAASARATAPSAIERPSAQCSIAFMTRAASSGRTRIWIDTMPSSVCRVSTQRRPYSTSRGSTPASDCTSRSRRQVFSSWDAVISRGAQAHAHSPRQPVGEGQRPGAEPAVAAIELVSASA